MIIDQQNFSPQLFGCYQKAPDGVKRQHIRSDSNEKDDVGCVVGDGLVPVENRVSVALKRRTSE